MAKRKATTDVPFEDVMSDNNNWLNNDDDDNDEEQDDLDKLYDKNKEIRDADNPMDQEVLREELYKKTMRRKVMKDNRQDQVDIPAHGFSLLEKGFFKLLTVLWMKKTSRIQHMSIKTETLES